MRAINSRLAKLEEKRSMRKATMLGILGILLIALAAVFGIPALIRIAIFVGELNSANKPIDKSDVIAPAPPGIGAPYDATNSATIAISGTTEPGANIFLSRNGMEAGSVVAKDDGVYQFNSVELSEGDNTFVAVAIDQSSNKSQSSRQINVHHTTKAPKLEIDTPTDRQNITNNQRSFEAKGSTDAGVRITINDRFVMVGSDGKFVSKVNLNEGENKLIFVATDKAGNTSRKELVVTYTVW